MCGITGIASCDRIIDRDLLDRMYSSIQHRGPDDHGVMVAQTENMAVGLASRRLSIIDLTDAGHMPMCNQQETLWIVYNGEIYNHLDIRSRLQTVNRVDFRSRTDTETVLKGYELQGQEIFKSLNGIFALAIYDQRERSVILARDRMGVKPLYYTWDGQELVFASELKAILANPKIRRELSPDALSPFLTFGFVPSPSSMITGISKLEPGHLLVLKDGHITIQAFWEPAYNFPASDPRNTKDLVELTRETLSLAVRDQLMSDVPLGVFLSGGLDSTIVASLVKKHHHEPLDTFSVGFAGKQGQVDRNDKENYDFYFARRVAHDLGARHHEVVFSQDDDLAAQLQEAVYYLEEPFREASFLSLHLMSKLAREHGVTVILTGDGGDELFAGYPWHLAALRMERYEQVPGLSLALPALARLAGNKELGIKARDLQGKLGQSDLVKYHLNHDVFTEEEKGRLLGPAVRETQPAGIINSVLENLLADSGSRSYADNLALVDLALWVREHFNHRIDRMSMRNSVEARVPFQDNAVVDLALSIPVRRKISRGQGKALLRQAFADLVPGYVLNRPKRPFAVPDLGWLRGPLEGYLAKDMLSGPLYEQQLLNRPAVQQLVAEFQAGQDNHAFKLWGLLILHMWSRAYLEDR